MGAVLGTRLALLPPAADELACSPLGTGSGSGVAAGWVAAGVVVTHLKMLSLLDKQLWLQLKVIIKLLFFLINRCQTEI